jgi:hypothetical protein
LNQTTLELGERRKDMEDQLARWAGRVDEPIAHRAKANTSIVQFLNQFDQVMHGATESIKSPDDKCVTLLQMGQACVETWTFGFSAGKNPTEERDPDRQCLHAHNRPTNR